jgi:hypothetical protein
MEERNYDRAKGQMLHQISKQEAKEEIFFIPVPHQIHAVKLFHSGIWLQYSGCGSGRISILFLNHNAIGESGDRKGQLDKRFRLKRDSNRKREKY